MNAWDVYRIIGIVILMAIGMFVVAVIAADQRQTKLALEEAKKDYLKHKKIGGERICKRNLKN